MQDGREAILNTQTVKRILLRYVWIIVGKGLEDVVAKQIF
jgi:hypothetical protein